MPSISENVWSRVPVQAAEWSKATENLEEHAIKDWAFRRNSLPRIGIDRDDPNEVIPLLRHRTLIAWERCGVTLPVVLQRLSYEAIRPQSDGERSAYQYVSEIFRRLLRGA